MSQRGKTGIILLLAETKLNRKWSLWMKKEGRLLHCSASPVPWGQTEVVRYHCITFVGPVQTEEEVWYYKCIGTIVSMVTLYHHTTPASFEAIICDGVIRKSTKSARGTIEITCYGERLRRRNFLHISGPGQRLSLSGEGLLYWSERDPVNVLTK